MTSKTKTTTTKEETPPALVPKLRFPEFRESQEWDRMPLASICNVLQGYGFPEAIQGKANGKYPFCKVSDISRAVAENAGVLAEAANYVDEAEVGMLRAKPIPPGATVFAKIGEALRLNRRAYVLNSCLIDNNAVALKGIDGLANDYFVYSLSQLIDLNKHCGGAVPSVNKTTLEQIQVCVPSLNEQQKIAECLSSVDELMAAQARKVEALKTHKKGLMQQLFPREGETQPRLRFPEFQNAGEWVAKSLGAIAPLQRGFDLPADEIRPGNVPIVYSNGPKGFHARGMAKGPGIVTGRSGTIGKIHFIESGDYWPHNTSLWVTSFEGHIPKFVYYLYESIRFLRFASGSGVPTLNRNDAHSFATSVPPHTDEQQRIASCLSSLDALITAETQKLEALKTHKKGLMQQLFPTAEEVEA
ncbi:restriction endonuclease subunit S [Acidithiobacillus ferriphilus]|uniref:restriction endonuclease subunit S n=1 Tax=Acidithiobacillus ferriphilus TaxID=1689834 RepID=UPI004056025C